MNLPNRLTLFRVILIPFFVFFLLTDLADFFSIIALLIFIAASLTDMLDGYIARKRNLVTDFGKFMDPLADKLLVCSALICLVSLDSLAAWIAVVIIAREFIISGVRLIAAQHSVVIAASMWGKYKTVFQMAMIILLIFNINIHFKIGGADLIRILTLIATWAALVLTVISLLDYIIKNKTVFANQD